jgi:hypothetical protein
MRTSIKTISYCLLLLLGLKLYLLFEITRLRFDYLASVNIIDDQASLTNLLLERQQNASLFLLLIYPIFLCGKILGITCILDTGFSLLKKTVPFRLLLLGVILAEYVYIFPDLIKLIWQQKWLENPYLPYLSFTPFPLLDQPTLPFFLKYLFNSFNLFECLYILLLSYAISALQKSAFLNNGILVIKTYGTFLLCWSLCIGLYLENIV